MCLTVMLKLIVIMVLVTLVKKDVDDLILEHRARIIIFFRNIICNIACQNQVLKSLMISYDLIVLPIHLVAIMQCFP